MCDRGALVVRRRRYRAGAVGQGQRRGHSTTASRARRTRVLFERASLLSECAKSGRDASTAGRRSRSKRGTEVTLFYTLLGSAKLAGVAPKACLRAATLVSLNGHVIPLPHEWSPVA